MASKENVERFVIAAKLENQQSIFIKSNMDAILLAEEFDEKEKEILAEAKRRYLTEVKEKTMENNKRLLEETFTDEEINELIKFFNSPVVQHYYKIMPELIQKITNFVNENEDIFLKRRIKIYEDVVSEFE
ncbi:MAG: DUF2059 domain-containing protein [Patescibacteria group bacterium]|jgi:hypothetical protein|nr:DUF2059 domain-containing protein [Patescibacteria group bacterium]